MKNLKDICNVNIPNSLHSLLDASLLDNAISEASLLDIDGTLDSGDHWAKERELIENEFKSLQKIKTTDWKDISVARQYTWECPAFIKKCTGIDANAIIFEVVVYEADDDNSVSPEVEMYIWREKGDIVSNDFGFLPMSVRSYPNRNKMWKDIIDYIKKNFTLHNLDWLKGQIKRRAKVDFFK